jgi:hypothetical protein
VRKITISHVSAVVKNLDILRTVVLLTRNTFISVEDTIRTIQYRSKYHFDRHSLFTYAFSTPKGFAPNSGEPKKSLDHSTLK